MSTNTAIERAMPPPGGTVVPPRPEQAIALLDAARERTLALVAHLSNEDLQRVHSPIVSPLVWDLAHIAAYEDLWLAHRHAGMGLLRPELAESYDAFETPRAVRGRVELLGPRETHDYLVGVRGRTRQALTRHGVGDGTLAEMVLRHELQHTETMRQTMSIAGLLAAGEPPLHPLSGEDAWIEVSAGPFTMGAAPEGFAYDNERPRHTVEVPAFRIARRPVSNGSWMGFSEGGGYERREWWSDEGWAWKEEYDIVRPSSVASGPAAVPVCHVSWFEADAFARAHGARLPSEAEWEKAASRDEGGALRGAGLVWEWTSSRFGGYPGFEAYPYPQYSEVFFGGDYRVLRGGSWATSERIATRTFRNWDHPYRRQIFAGVRLAMDEA